MATREEIWPFYGLQLQTPRLELRFAADDELIDLTNAAVTVGIHDPSEMPFSSPWSRQPSPQLQRGTLQWNWEQRSSISPARWSLPLTMFLEGRPIGVQDLIAANFARTRTVSSGSWMLRSHQGQGLGKEMRAAVLHLAFNGLGALRAETSANADNAASNGVSRSLGYRPDGTKIDIVENRRNLVSRYVMDLDDWNASAAKATSVTLHGVEACTPLLVESLDSGMGL